MGELVERPPLELELRTQNSELRTQIQTSNTLLELFIMI